jgi:hypothetical protein
MPPDLGGGEAALGMEPELGMDALGGGPDGMGGGMPPPPFPSINPAMWQQMIQALIGGDAAKLAQLQQMQAQQLAQGQQDALGQAIAAIQQQAEAAGALTADGDVGAPPPLPGPSQAAAERVIGY